jgi:hypothetical protein
MGDERSNLEFSKKHHSVVIDNAILPSRNRATSLQFCLFIVTFYEKFCASIDAMKFSVVRSVRKYLIQADDGRLNFSISPAIILTSTLQFFKESENLV